MNLTRFVLAREPCGLDSAGLSMRAIDPARALQEQESDKPFEQDPDKVARSHQRSESIAVDRFKSVVGRRPSISAILPAWLFTLIGSIASA